MGEETRGTVLRVQGQRGGMQQDQAHTQLHGVRRQPPRLQGDGAGADGAAQGGPRRTCLARRGICRDGRCGESEAQDSDNLREGPERPSLDGGAEGTQPAEVEGAQPCGTYLRIYGADDGGPDIPRSGLDKGKSQHRIDKPRLQYVPTGANREIPIKFNHNTISRISNNYPPPTKLWQKVHCQMKK